MTFDQLADGAAKPAWDGILPGRPAPYFLQKGEGEHSKVYDILVMVLRLGDETDGQFSVFTTLEPKGNLVVPHVHAEVHELFYALAVGNVHAGPNARNRQIAGHRRTSIV